MKESLLGAADNTTLGLSFGEGEHPSLRGRAAGEFDLGVAWVLGFVVRFGQSRIELPCGNLTWQRDGLLE